MTPSMHHSEGASMRWTMVATVVLASMSGCASADLPDEPDDLAGESLALLELPTVGTIERLHPSFDQVVPTDAQIRLLVDGHEWTEGPVWVPELGALLYSEIPSNTVYRWTDQSGEALWLRPSGYTGALPRTGEQGSNGLAIGPDGSLLLAQHGDRRIARLDAAWDNPQPRFTTLAGEYQGRRFNSPNDLAVHRNGDIYFTDPPYGLEGGNEQRELDIDGVYRLSAGGELTRIIDDLRRPNGVVLSPSQETLYVSGAGVVMAYVVEGDGSIGAGRPFLDGVGGADGMAVDQDGRLYVGAQRLGVLVIAPDGTHLGSLVPGGRVSNVAFGDDGSTLYATGVQVVAIRVLAKGVGF